MRSLCRGLRARIPVERPLDLRGIRILSQQ
jgi:hypothetical protein